MKILLASFFFALIFLAPVADAATFKPVPASNQIVFDIFRDGKKLGTHVISFSKGQGNVTTAKIAIDMKYDLGPITVFRYTHRNQERWLNNRPLSIATTTNDNGKNFKVEANWDLERLEIRTDKGLQDAKAGIFPTSYWNKKSLISDKILNTQYGSIETLSVSKPEKVKISVAGEERVVSKYKVQTVGMGKTNNLQVYYDDKTGQWVGLKFSARGADIEYRRTNKVGS
jgi:hypothetical protein